MPSRHMGKVAVWLPSFVTAALDGSYWSASHTCIIMPRKEPLYSLNRRLGGPQSQSG